MLVGNSLLEALVVSDKPYSNGLRVGHDLVYVRDFSFLSYPRAHFLGFLGIRINFVHLIHGLDGPASLDPCLISLSYGPFRLDLLLSMCS